jgi:hypothetical protein
MTMPSHGFPKLAGHVACRSVKIAAPAADPDRPGVREDGFVRVAGQGWGCQGGLARLHRRQHLRNIFGSPADTAQQGHEAVVARNSCMVEEAYGHAGRYLHGIPPELILAGHSWSIENPRRQGLALAAIDITQDGVRRGQLFDALLDVAGRFGS